MLKKLRTKFVVINMVIVTVLMAVIFAMVISFTKASLAADSVQALQTVATARPNDRVQVSFPHFRLELDQRGEALSVSGNYYDHYTTEELIAIGAEAAATGKQTGILKDYGLRFFRSPSPRGDSIAFADISAERAALSSLAHSCAVIGVLAFVVFLLVSIWLAFWAVKPVEQAWQQQRQFIADASHELKTPLTVILTNAELLGSEDYPPEQKQGFRDNILTMSRQMRSLVERMLELTRVDNGSLQTVFAPLSLSTLAEEALLPFEPLYFEQGLGLEVALSPDVKVRGSAQHLTQVLEILLDNAMKYSTPGGTVRITLKSQGAHALLSVYSPGQTIAQEELENLFKRFYRMDKARSRDGSYGLGLSIARSIVNEHGGRIWAQSAEGINSFHVLLPRRD